MSRLAALLPARLRRALARARDRLSAALVDVREGLRARQLLRAVKAAPVDPDGLDPEERALFAEIAKARTYPVCHLLDPDVPALACGKSLALARMEGDTQTSSRTRFRMRLGQCPECARALGSSAGKPS